MNKYLFICSTCRHYNSHKFHTVIRIHLISLLSHSLVLPSHFIEQMLMLMSSSIICYYIYSQSSTAVTHCVLVTSHVTDPEKDGSLCHAREWLIRELNPCHCRPVGALGGSPVPFALQPDSYTFE